jgi:hypothetical protein
MEGSVLCRLKLTCGSPPPALAPRLPPSIISSIATHTRTSAPLALAPSPLSLHDGRSTGGRSPRLARRVCTGDTWVPRERCPRWSKRSDPVRRHPLILATQHTAMQKLRMGYDLAHQLKSILAVRRLATSHSPHTPPHCDSLPAPTFSSITALSVDRANVSASLSVMSLR